MPMVATSPSRWTYSCVLAYLLSSGVVVIRRSLLLPGAFVERSRHDTRACFFPANQDCELGSQRRFPLRKICETDRLFQCRRVRAAGDNADLFLAIDDRIAVAGDAAVDHLESDELA